MASFWVFNDSDNNGSIRVEDLADPNQPVVCYPNNDHFKPPDNPLPPRTAPYWFSATNLADGTSRVRWSSSNIGFGTVDASVNDGLTYNASDGSQKQAE